MTTIITIGFIQALFFAVLALSKRQKETVDYYVAALFLFLCIHLSVNFILFTDYKYRFPHVIGTAGPLSLLYGPLLFFFIKNYLSPRHRFKTKYLLHFVPFLADHVHNAFILYFKSGAEKIAVLESIIAGKPDAALSLTIMLQTMSPVIYCIWSILVLKAHRRNVLKLYSFTDDALKLRWLWYLTWSMLIVAAIALITNIIIVLFDVADWVQLRLYVMTIVAIWVFLLGYYSVRKTPFYRSYPVAGMDTLDDDDDEASEKYGKTRLRDEEIQPMKDKLMEYLHGEKPYFNKNLTIGELATAIDVQPYQLSQLINGTLGQSFFELINSMRVEEVQHRFFEPQYSRFTLPGIAMDCGFNSKASFNRIFKQITGQTPTEFIKSKSSA
ncbi:MAG: helix-turn-helix domain-containing protein [Cyclobacteriaceae bacterium]|nr:helix-turn-helix domain-containing protein [Cyclobacteriaceae bacterium]